LIAAAVRSGACNFINRGDVVADGLLGQAQPSRDLSVADA
jgi:hypothetical protein